MKFLKKQVNSTVFGLLMALYFILFLNMTIFRHIYKILQDTQDVTIWFVISIFFLFLAVFNFVLVFCTIKYIEKPLFVILILVSSLVNYAMYHYGIIFDHHMITNIFETNVHEASSYWNGTFFSWFLLTGIIPAFIVSQLQITHHGFLKDVGTKIISIIVSLGVLGVLAFFYFPDYAAIGRNNSILRKEIVPYYYVSSTIKYVKNTYFAKKVAYEEVGVDAVKIAEEKPNLLIFLVGETARAQNYQLNGYERDTNHFSKDIKNIVSFKDAQSCGTATAVSVPCMFSLLGKKGYSRSKFENQDNITDIIKRAGVDISWVNNNDGCKGVCRNIKTTDVDFSNAKYCKKGVCKDDIALPMIDDILSNLGTKDTALFFHLMGSHGPTYYRRYWGDHKRFAPDCPRSDIQNCTNEELVNTYDNTIVFTDYVMSEIIKKIEPYQDKYNPVLIYVSDHGESLGENGIYLHGMPYNLAPEQQIKVPFIVWMPDEVLKRKKIDIDCLKRDAANKKISHDNISHTLLGVLNIQTEVYNKELDILGSCKK